jgi:hypothetical protein
VKKQLSIGDTSGLNALSGGLSSLGISGMVPSESKSDTPAKPLDTSRTCYTEFRSSKSPEQVRMAILACVYVLMPSHMCVRVCMREYAFCVRNHV